MATQRRPSSQTARVLRALAHQPGAWRYGYDLGADVGLKSGTLYPILMRLAERGLLHTAWEDDPPHGRPARHLYRLTPEGLRLAREVGPAPARVQVGVELGGST